MYFVLIRGCLQFGVLASAIYVLLHVLIEDVSISTLRWGIVIGFPVFGLLWGGILWWFERSRAKGS